MATVNPPVRYQEEDNYEIELSRVREKIRTQFGDLTDRLKCRERELLEELDTVLASYRSYRDEFKIIRDKVRDLEKIKQRNEEELAASQFKMLQEKIIKQIEEEIKTIIYPKEPQLVTFVFENNIIFSEIDKLGKLVKKVTDTYSHPSSPRIIPSNDDVIEFYDQDKPYFEFTPYSRHTVHIDGITWKTLTHYFQAQKFSSKNEIRKIADAPTPIRATYLANTELKKLTKDLSLNEKEIIMKRGLEAKFTQHTDLRRMLLDTGTKKLMFIHPEDIIWGTRKSKSIGQNKLGELLMNLRNKLRVPLSSTDSRFDPKNIRCTNSDSCSSDDDNTTQLRNVKGQVSYINKTISFPPKKESNK